MACQQETIEARIESGAAASTIRFEPGDGMSYPPDPPDIALRAVSIFDLRCAACGKHLTKRDVGHRFARGGDLHHPRFRMQYASWWPCRR